MYTDATNTIFTISCQAFVTKIEISYTISVFILKVKVGRFSRNKLNINDCFNFSPIKGLSCRLDDSACLANLFKFDQISVKKVVVMVIIGKIQPSGDNDQQSALQDLLAKLLY